MVLSSVLEELRFPPRKGQLSHSDLSRQCGREWRQLLSLSLLMASAREP